MNNVFLRDRMERNNSDFEGSGIGEGRFDEYAVRRQLRLNMTENSSLLHGKHRMEERILTMLRMHLIKAIQ